METKKSEKADLEWRKPLFFEIGLCAALALTLMAFELVGPREKQETIIVSTSVEAEEEQVLQTKREPELPPPPPAPAVNNSVLDIVNNNMKIDNEIEIDVTAEEDDPTEHYDYVEEVQEEETPEENIFEFVEVLPEFPGGDEARMKFLRENLVYPTVAKNAGLQGKVVVEFVVEPDGSLSNIRIKRGKAPSLDEEALRVVKMMPKWTPGKQRNKAVRCRFSLPIIFQLSN